MATVYDLFEEARRLDAASVEDVLKAHKVDAPRLHHAIPEKVLYHHRLSASQRAGLDRDLCEIIAWGRAFEVVSVKDVLETPEQHKARILAQPFWEPYQPAEYPNGLGAAMQSEEALAAWDKKYGYEETV